MGSGAHTRAEGLAYQPGECILEIGAERGEGSTPYLAGVAAAAGVPFYSIDPDLSAQARVPAGVTLITARAEDALQAWQHETPAFVWLDGFDWPYSWHLPDTERLRGLYARWDGGAVTEQASAESHLQIARLLDRLMPAGTVVIDDTWLRTSDHQWRGKGGTAVPWMVGTGRWRLEGFAEAEEPADGHAVLERKPALSGCCHGEAVSPSNGQHGPKAPRSIR